ncbi:MAG: hypothetical protein ACF8Q5_02590 [Phycisphaerales bacterium JB040]
MSGHQPPRWAWGLFAGVPVLLATPLGLLASPSPEMLRAVYSEGGFIELAQQGVWSASALCAGLLFWRERGPHGHRMVTLWLGVLAVLFLLRELDLHESLNPEVLGDWGVRYRIDWWLDGSVAWWLKGLWAGVGVLVGAAVVVPLVLAGGIRGMPHKDSARLRLLAGAAVCLGMGFVFDDLLRHVITNEAVKQTCEEGWELAGAVLYLGAVLAGAHARGAGAERAGAENAGG